MSPHYAITQRTTSTCNIHAIFVNYIMLFIFSKYFIITTCIFNFFLILSILLKYITRNSRSNDNNLVKSMDGGGGEGDMEHLVSQIGHSTSLEKLYVWVNLAAKGEQEGGSINPSLGFPLLRRLLRRRQEEGRGTQDLVSRPSNNLDFF